MRATARMALAVTASAGLTGATAQAAVPAYRSFEVPAPQLQAGANFGERLRAIRDIDGDGARDVLMSASNYDGDDGSGVTLPNSGRVYIFSGRTRALLRTLEPPNPQANAKFGFWDASLGDVDGDGAGDFVISAAGQVIGGATLGQVYVYSGRTTTRLRTISPPEPLAASPMGFGGDFGGNVIAPGDLNGNGSGDFVATASGAFAGVGAAYAFDGATGAFLYKVPNPDGTQAGSFGFGAAELGDVNGDGTNDYQVGAPRFDEGTLVDVGRAYVINGRTGAVLFTLRNPEPEANDRFGQADADGAAIGDISGDGVPDIYVDVFLGNDGPVGAPSLDNAGKAILFSGATGTRIGTLRDPNPQGGRNFGASNAGAGDIDGDGRADLLVSSRGGGGTTSVGSVAVFGGPLLTSLLTTFQAPSNQGGAFFGTGLASPGDVNGDGAPDYFMSARGQDVGSAVDAGIAYAFISQVPAAPAPVAPAAVVPTPKPPVPPAPGPVTRKLPVLLASVTPASDRRAPYRFTARGTLKLPAGVSTAEGCRGKARVTVKRLGNAKTLSSRLVTVNGACRFTSAVSFATRAALGKSARGTLRFTVRFQGNALLVPKQVTRTARYG